MKKLGTCSVCCQFRQVEIISRMCERCHKERRRKLRRVDFKNKDGNTKLRIADIDSALIPTQNGYFLTHLEWAEIATVINSFYENETPIRIANANSEIAKEKRLDYMESLVDDAGLAKKRPVCSGYLYLLRSDNGYYKIGRTINMQRRMAGYARQYPIEIKLMCFYRCADYIAEETALLREYHEYRLGQSEWCDFPPR